MRKAAKRPPTVRHDDCFDEVTYQRNLFVTMTLTMTWQLAFAVIVPVVGGYYLDRYLGWSPVLTIAGAVVAALGAAGVMIRIVRDANRQAARARKKEDKK